MLQRHSRVMASYSSLGASARRGRSAAYDDVDRSIYALGSTLASIVNDPRLTSTSSSFWGLGSSADAEPPPPPPLDPTRYPPVSRADLQGYVNLVHGTYERFERDCQALDALQTTHEPDSGADTDCAHVGCCTPPPSCSSCTAPIPSLL